MEIKGDVPKLAYKMICVLPQIDALLNTIEPRRLPSIQDTRCSQRENWIIIFTHLPHLQKMGIGNDAFGCHQKKMGLSGIMCVHIFAFDCEWQSHEFAIQLQTKPARNWLIASSFADYWRVGQYSLNCTNFSYYRLMQNVHCWIFFNITAVLTSNIVAKRFSTLVKAKTYSLGVRIYLSK